jgi:hypothetical protein
MKDLIGIKVQALADGVKVEGIVVQDKLDRVFIKIANGKIARVIKSHITLFTPETEPEAFVPFQLLACHNPDIGCPGVRYVVEGEKLTRQMFSVFMDPCPLKQESCRCGTKGDLRTLSSATMKQTMCGVMFGDYPQQEQKNERTGRKDEASSRGAKKG